MVDLYPPGVLVTVGGEEGVGGGRLLAARVFISKSTLSAWENGKHAFKEDVLRAHLYNLDADEDLIDFCLKNRQRIEDLIALSNASRLPRLANIEIGDKPPASTGPEHGKWCIFERISSAAVGYVVLMIFTLVFVFWATSRMSHIQIHEPKPLPPVTMFGEWVTGIYNSQEDYRACMGVEGASTQDHAIVSMFGCLYNDWRLTPLVNVDGYAVANVNSGKCLDRTDGDQVVQQKCSSYDSARSWQIILLGHQEIYGDLSVTFINRNRDKEGCLTIVPVMSQNDLRLTLAVATCTGTANQKFWIIPRPPENLGNR